VCDLILTQDVQDAVLMVGVVQGVLRGHGAGQDLAVHADVQRQGQGRIASCLLKKYIY